MSFFIYSERTSSCKELPTLYFNIKSKKAILWNNIINGYVYLYYNKKENKFESTSHFKYTNCDFLKFYRCNENNKYFIKIKKKLKSYNIKYSYVFIDFY